MSTHDATSHGALALLGGEGLRPDSAPLWQHLASLAPAQMRHTLIVPAALAGEKVGTPERRAGAAAEGLARLGVEAQVVAILSREQAADPARVAPLMDADCLYLIGGGPRVLVDVLRDTPAWEALRVRHTQGALLIASSGAAVVLGVRGFAPERAFEQSLDGLHLEPFDGLGLLDSLVIMPYFGWLQPRVVDKVAALCPPGAQLVGIDDQAALIAALGGWQVAGFGSVTIWQPGGSRCVIDAGHAVPDGFLPPYP